MSEPGWLSRQYEMAIEEMQQLPAWMRRGIMAEPQLDRAGIAIRVERATPGPWRYDAESGRVLVAAEIELVGVSRRWWGTPDDSTFIAHARQDVPALLSALDTHERLKVMHLAVVKLAETQTVELAEMRREIAAVAADRDALRRLLDSQAQDYAALAAERDRLQQALHHEVDVIMERDALRAACEMALLDILTEDAHDDGCGSVLNDGPSPCTCLWPERRQQIQHALSVGKAE